MVASEKLTLYAYTDETGQDTKGDFFIVATVLVKKDQKKGLEEYLVSIEGNSGKNKVKWTSTEFERRKNYLEHLANIPEKIKPVVYFSNFKNTTQYMHNTGKSIGRAIKTELPEQKNYKAKILIDGLRGKEVRKISSIMRDKKIRYDKIRGVDDKHSCITRLADSMAGFLRDCHVKKDYRKKEIYEKLYDERAMMKKGKRC